MTEFIFGLYDENKNLIGWKTDSFWSLSKNRNNAKPDSLVKNTIKPHLISNLEFILCKKENDHQKDGNAKEILGILQDRQKRLFYGRFETMLLGFEPLQEGVMPIFTHRVFPDRIEPLNEFLS